MADRKVKCDKVVEAQTNNSEILCEGGALKQVFEFKYLGSVHTADGDHERDVEKRCALAASRCGELRAVFNADHIPLRLNG